MTTFTYLLVAKEDANVHCTSFKTSTTKLMDLFSNLKGATTQTSELLRNSYMGSLESATVVSSVATHKSDESRKRWHNRECHRWLLFVVYRSRE
jgi:hypothetical protein